MPLTCDNRQQGRKNASVRLDRAVADQSWRDVFGQATVHHLVSSRSDHCPILIRMQKEVWQPRQGKPMRYEIMWEREECLQDVIKEAWLSTSRRGDLGEISLSLQEVMRKLKNWSSDHFGSIKKELEELRKKLEHLQLNYIEDKRKEMRQVMDRMDEILYWEEMMWLQRSCISWLREGDHNTGFFHQKATWKSKKNKI